MHTLKKVCCLAEIVVLSVNGEQAASISNNHLSFMHLCHWFLLFFSADTNINMSDLPTSPVAGDIAAFNKDGLKKAETQEKNQLPSSDGKPT